MGATWTAQVKLGEHWGAIANLPLLTNAPSDSWTLPFPAHSYKVELLKSALQKCVRRRKAESAVRVGWQLLCQDPDQLLRRLPIIILEDGCLHRHFSYIVWLMVATSKGWKLSKSQVVLILRVIFEVAEVSWRDPIPMVPTEGFKNPALDRPEGTLCPIAHVLASLVLRVNYGGMKGDMEMLKKFAIVWNERYKKNPEEWDKEREVWFSQLPPEPNFEELISKGPVLTDADKISEAIDFHCFPQLVDKCTEELEGFSKEDIKSAVWWHRSGLNLKKPVCHPKNPYLIKYYDNLESEEIGKRETLSQWECVGPLWIKKCNSSFWRPLQNQSINNSNSKKPKPTHKPNTQANSITNYFKKGTTNNSNNTSTRTNTTNSNTKSHNNSITNYFKKASPEKPKEEPNQNDKT
uniref:Uncharacterized protein n=1 Tax=Arcella intermedia TaxID=1963864 RepID=A0A6B2L588_9EUKA